jgi:hypothetical protein
VVDPLGPPATVIGAQVGELSAESVDLSRKSHAQSTNVTVDGGRAQEVVVEILRAEIDRKNGEIERLRTDNDSLRGRIDAIDNVFQMINILVGEYYSLSPNKYIVHAFLFIRDRGLSSEFGSYLSSEALRTSREDD